MRQRAHHLFRMAVAASVATAVAVPVFAQPSFTGLGDLPGGQVLSEVWGVSADGSTVVGDSIISGHLPFGATYGAFRWTAATGMVNIYSLPGIGTACRSYAVSADGSVVAGSADYGVLSPTQIVAFIWTSGTGVIEIGDLPGGPSGSARAAARALAADGGVVAGQGESDSGAEPFRYTRDEMSFEGLGDLSGGAFGGSAYGISADGSTIVGSSIAEDGTQAFRWNQSQGMFGLGYLPTAEGVTPFSEAYAANADGSVIVGLSRSLASGQNGWEAFRWTADGGMVGLGDLPGGNVLSAAYAATADGSIVVGSGGVLGTPTPFGTPTVPRAMIWDAQHGMRDLGAVLTAAGINLTGWTLSEARGISANGRVIVGTGTNPSGSVEAWRADLGPSGLPGDLNCDGLVNNFDIDPFVLALSDPVAYQAAYPNCDISNADINGDGNVNNFDIDPMVELLSGG